MTEKLYYKDAYIKEFFANIVDITPCDRGFDIVLDKTAFFPEEGGQSSDTGFISECEVVYVYEKDGIVHHITKSEPPKSEVLCKINFCERFEKMQCHTAEHILCGIINKLFGLENVGFHLGADEVLFDVNGVLDRAALDKVEALANEAVFSNLDIKSYFPSLEELSGLEYRAKLDITENVRIVKIGDVDTCACCAPHVSKTGEVGLIKILDFMKHRGGTRIWIVAGRRALSDYRTKYENILKISALLSTPQHETAETLERYIKDAEGIKSSLKNSRLLLAEEKARSMPDTEGNSVCELNDFSFDELRAFANAYKSRVGKILVAVSGIDGEYRYVLASERVNLSERIKEINASLDGRGGGKPGMVQGTFRAALSEIKKYFE